MFKIGYNPSTVQVMGSESTRHSRIFLLYFNRHICSKHNKEFVNHVLLVQCCRGVDNDDYGFYGYGATSCHRRFPKLFGECIAYMYRVEHGKYQTSGVNYQQKAVFESILIVFIMCINAHQTRRLFGPSRNIIKSLKYTNSDDDDDDNNNNNNSNYDIFISDYKGLDIKIRS